MELLLVLQDEVLQLQPACLHTDQREHTVTTAQVLVPTDQVELLALLIAVTTASVLAMVVDATSALVGVVVR